MTALTPEAARAAAEWLDEIGYADDPADQLRAKADRLEFGGVATHITVNRTDLRALLNYTEARDPSSGGVAALVDRLRKALS